MDRICPVPTSDSDGRRVIFQWCGPVARHDRDVGTFFGPSWDRAFITMSALEA